MPLSGISTLVAATALGLAVQTASPQGSAPADPPSRALLLELTAQPRVAGTIGSIVGADICARHLREAGWKVEIDEREVMLSLPRSIGVEIFDGENATPLHARSQSYNPDAIPPGDLPLCNAWSASADVRAEVVDVGRGLRADFERLKAAGVEVKGKIALARYGGAYRGIKVDLATQYGCVGVLLFAERAKTGEAWPAGPNKPGYEAERGSISPIARTPGDPSTPGWPSPHPGEKAKRLSKAELDEALPKIPCTPIGWAEAEMIQAHLQLRDMMGVEGHDVKTPIGPGPALVHLVTDQPREVRTIRNVVATLPGASEDCVIAGAHRDAWVRGANDDGSGVVCMIRAAQRLGDKVKSGWKPANTVIIALWDAEEFGMIGSTEWAEAHADMITQHCFAYVNSDTGCSGTHFRGASGTPGLLRVLKTALERVPTPEPRKDGEAKNLWEDWGTGLKPGEPAEIEPAGSGSDFVAFLHHLSRPVVDISLSGNHGGQYHTNFDDVAMVDRYLDPGFVGHEMCGQLIAELLSEMSEEGRDSFDAVEASKALARLADQASKLKDPGASNPWLGPEAAKSIRAGFSALASMCESDKKSTNIYALLASPGISGREWFHNVIWTPGLEDGYGSEYFPLLHVSSDGTAQVIGSELTSDSPIERMRSCLGLGTQVIRKR